MTDTAVNSTLNVGPGLQLGLRDWPLADNNAARAHVLIVHGLGEHSGRYAHVARRLNDWGYACMAKGLGMAIAEAAQRPIVSAKVVPTAHWEYAD